MRPRRGQSVDAYLEIAFGFTRPGNSPNLTTGKVRVRKEQWPPAVFFPS